MLKNEEFLMNIFISGTGDTLDSGLSTLKFSNFNELSSASNKRVRPKSSYFEEYNEYKDDYEGDEKLIHSDIYPNDEYSENSVYSQIKESTYSQTKDSTYSQTKDPTNYSQSFSHKESIFSNSKSLSKHQSSSHKSHNPTQCSSNSPSTGNIPTSSPLKALECNDFLSTSPLLNRKPLKNLSNIVLPNMKKKFTMSTKNLTRSMSSVARSTPFFSSQVKHNEKVTINEQKQQTHNEQVTNDPESTMFNEPNEPLTSNTISPHIDSSPTQQKDSRTIRRIHSMYQTTQEKECFRMEDNSHLKNTTITTFTLDKDHLPRIDEEQLLRILKGQHNQDFDEYIVVDCRFNYEFDGGHINGAINISSQDELESKFINSNIAKSKKQLLIFHCEFSLFRGPTMAGYLRKCDRSLNRDSYPLLSFPDIVILDGGYKQFFLKYGNYCFPQGYIEMKDSNHEKNCESQMNKVRLESKLTRAKSHNHFHSESKPFPGHSRSQSYTTISSEKVVKRQKSNSKFKNINGLRLDNRLSRASTFSNDQSLFNSGNSSDLPSPIFGHYSSTSQNKPLLDDDFQPPSASFRGHRNSYSGNFSSSSTSINSPSSSICSDTGFSSSESLAASYSSPIGEFSEYFESKNLTNYMKSSNIANNHSTSTLTNFMSPMTRKPSGQLPLLPNRLNNISNATINIINQNVTSLNSPSMANQNPTFKFPTLKQKGSRQSLNRISTNSNQSLSSTNVVNSGNSNNGSRSVTSTPNVISSPIISSPLSTATPMSTLDSTVSMHASSILDPINDTSVEFTVPFSSKRNYHSRKASGSLLSAGGGLYNSITLDLYDADVHEDEERNNVYWRRSSLAIDEEDDDENEGTITEVKIPTYFQKSPFS
jgi:M-phase inducer tyrosine phosphatase